MSDFEAISWKSLLVAFLALLVHYEMYEKPSTSTILSTDFSRATRFRRCEEVRISNIEEAQNWLKALTFVTSQDLDAADQPILYFLKEFPQLKSLCFRHRWFILASMMA